MSRRSVLILAATVGLVAMVTHPVAGLSATAEPSHRTIQELTDRSLAEPSVRHPVTPAGRELNSLGYLVPHLGRYLRIKADLASRASLSPLRSPLDSAPPQQSMNPSAVDPSWGGLAESRFAPSDSTGAIGLDRYVEFVNSSFGVFDRSGSLIDSGTLAHLMASAYVVDPQVIWDSQTGRFYYAALNATNALTGTGSNELLFGWSRDAFPLTPADWCSYSETFGTTVPDFPKLGDMTGFLEIGVNDFSALGDFQSSELDVFSKPPSGTSCERASSIAFQSFTGLQNADSTLTLTPVPVNEIDPEPLGYVLAAAGVPLGGAGDYVTIYAVSGAGGTISLSSPTTLAVPSFSLPPPVPQSGSTYTLDSLDGRLTNAVGAFDPVLGRLALWSQHTVAGGAGSEVAWYEIDPSGPSLAQSGAISDGVQDAFNAAIAPDRAYDGTTGAFGDSAVVTFNESSVDSDVSVDVVDIAASVAGSVPLVLAQSSVPYTNPTFPTTDCAVTGTCRWGDYSGASPDPAVKGITSGSVWVTNMWSGTAGWHTWNAQIAPSGSVPTRRSVTVSGQLSKFYARKGGYDFFHKGSRIYDTGSVSPAAPGYPIYFVLWRRVSGHLRYLSTSHFAMGPRGTVTVYYRLRQGVYAIRCFFIGDSLLLSGLSRASYFEVTRK
jgi:hypothetical protein